MIGAARRTRMRLVSHCAAKPLRTGAAFARGTRLPTPRPPGPYSMCGRGGTGRRAALRSLWPKGRGSSSLLDRTNPLKAKDFSEGLAQFGTLPFPEYAVKRSKSGMDEEPVPADQLPNDAGTATAANRQIAAGSRPLSSDFGKPPRPSQHHDARREPVRTLRHHPANRAFGIA